MAVLLDCEGYHRRYNVVIIKLASRAKFERQNPSEKFICKPLQSCNDSAYTCRAESPESFGVAEVEKPQSGGADCGYTLPDLRKVALTKHGGPHQSRLQLTRGHRGGQTADSSIAMGHKCRPKICLANYYGFVIMRATYEKYVPFLWNRPAMVRPVDRMYVFNFSRY